ncbi:MAG TPA: DUF4412 domain-containing protein [Chryseolinea sp.]|nr:DUF4412 domain-containing protein [Chryseolinea sp.]
MKKIIILLLLSTTIAYAQNFEGTIVWKITSQITDPATKAKMDEANKKMNDPATQAQMKELKEKMNDPQFKAMMESNPQMKAQMENMIKMTEGGGGLSSMMPTGYIVKIKDENTLTKMEGGMMSNMEMLYLKNKNATYQLDREKKTYKVLPHMMNDTTKLPDVKVTKTAETTKILNYPCTKYIVETTSKGHAMQQFFWTTTAIKDLDMKSFAQQRMGNGQQSFFYEKIEGVPLKIEIKQPQGAMIMEATEFKKQSLPASDFSLPVGFKEVH